MAIAFDAYTAYSGSGSESTMTQSHTVSGTNTFLFVDVRAVSSSDVITGVTYNGVAMTRITGFAVGIAGNDYHEAYYLFGAATGAHDVVASLSSGVGSSLRIASYNGVNQAGLDNSGSTNPGNASSTSISLSITSSADNCWMVGMLRNQAGANTVTVGTDRSGGADAISIADSGPKTPAGSITLTATHSAHYDAAIGVTIAPAADTANGNMLSVF